MLDEGDLRPAGPRPGSGGHPPFGTPGGPAARHASPASRTGRSSRPKLVVGGGAGGSHGGGSGTRLPLGVAARRIGAGQTAAGDGTTASSSGGNSQSAADARAFPFRPPWSAGIQSAIEGWQHAILSGDPDLIAACYAPQLERYFDQRNSSSARVRQAALRSFQHFGKPAILRVSELAILPESPDRAIATFRKHWQTHGPKVFAGEEQERLAFVLDRDGTPPFWKIVSEEETKVYWTQRPRTRGSGTR